MTRDILKNKKNALRIRVACLVMVSVILGGCVAKEKLEGYLSDSIGRLSGSKEYHVSVNGSDRNKGSASSPFKTISAAADVAQPGDTITVHEGIYRERINPPRGGLSDDMRIVYQAAEGQNVQIKGSEIVVGWKKIQDGVWKVTVPNTFFGNYNPYKDCLAGDWGEGEVKVYLDGDSRWPTLVGTGLEDYIGTGWGLGTYINDHQGSLVADHSLGHYAFYRYHVPDPIYFDKDCRVTIQQIGGGPNAVVSRMLENDVKFKPVSVDGGGAAKFTKILEQSPPLSIDNPSFPQGHVNIYRQDDYSATAFFYLDSPSNNLPELVDMEKRLEGLD